MAKERALMSTRAGSPWYIRGRQSSQSDFFADEAMMKCEKFLLIPTVIETEDSQNHYIEITIRKGN